MNRLAQIVVGAILLSAAAAAFAKTQSDKAITPGEGAVLLTFARDYPTEQVIHLVSPQADPDITVEKVDDPRNPRYSLAPRVAGLFSSVAYAGSLPPGRYRIVDLFDYSVRSRQPQADDLAQFEVVPGEITWLGSIMMREEPREQGKGKEVLWAYEDEPAMALGQRLLEGAYAELAAAKAKLALHWHPFGNGARAAAAARDRMRSGAYGMVDFGYWGDDGFCLGAQYGIAKCWNRTRGYQIVETGIPYVLRSVLRGADGGVLAAGEAATLLYSPDDGAHWMDAGSGLPWGVADQIVDIGNGELLFTLLTDKRVRLYRGRMADREWKLAGDYPLEESIWAIRKDAYPQLRVQGRTAILTLPGKKAVAVDLDSDRSRVFDMAGEILKFAFSRDGVLRCLCSVKLRESRDFGKTWQKLSTDPWMAFPAFRSASEGFSYHNKSGQIRSTGDGGKTWSPLAQLGIPPNAGWALPAYSRDGSVMVLYGRTRDKKFNFVEEVHVSTDDGKSWQLVSKPPAWLSNPEAASLKRW